MTDSGQLIKRGTTHPAYEKLLREEAPLGQLARLEPLQPDAPLYKLPIPRQTHPVYTGLWHSRPLSHSQWYTQASPVW